MSHQDMPDGPDHAPSDPETGEPREVHDARERFAEMTRRQPRDREAERAFIMARIAMVKGHPDLSESAKARAIEKLRAMLDHE